MIPLDRASPLVGMAGMTSGITETDGPGRPAAPGILGVIEGDREGTLRETWRVEGGPEAGPGRP